MGFSFDFEREVNTTDPQFYAWTQWIFLQLFTKGLAFQKETLVWWCEALGTVLANEEVIDGKSERGNHPCVRMPLSQWMLGITKYADRLYEDLDQTEYLDHIKTQQRNWIGKSKGAEFSFDVQNSDERITVFTTRADTFFGITYLVLAPEHPFVRTVIADEKGDAVISNRDEVKAYIASAKEKNDLERTEAKEKTGVQLKGVFVTHPGTGEALPVWVADYVLGDYGTGAVMAVPAHDERDAQFAGVYSLPQVCVLSETDQGCTLIDSGEFSGMNADEAKIKIAEKFGKQVTTYKLRDWVFSRQRYWGEPFPIVWISETAYARIQASYSDGVVAKLLPQSPVRAQKNNTAVCAAPISPNFLPVALPKVKSFEPKGDGKSALGTATSWLNVLYNVKTGEAIPSSSLKGKVIQKRIALGKKTDWVEGVRETDTMPNWAGSSWYWLRYTDPNNKKALASEAMLSSWTPVDWYNGGMEHVTLHLLYARFWNKFLYDIGVTPTTEPFIKRTAQGMVLGEGGIKMSKSLGNVVSPDSIVEIYGADTLRVYEMFAGPYDQSFTWSTDNMIGSRRFLEKVWKVGLYLQRGPFKQEHAASLDRILHETIKKVGEDIEKMQFNTAISSLMICINAFEEEIQKERMIKKETFTTFLQLLAPFAPHITEHIWQDLKLKGSIHSMPWPLHDETKIAVHAHTVVIQINGKVRAEIELEAGVSAEKAEEMSRERAQPWLSGKEIVKVVYVPHKIINFVIR